MMSPTNQGGRPKLLEVSVLLSILMLSLLSLSYGFSPPQRKLLTRPSTRLCMADFSVRTPSQEEAESLGIREWPQQAKSKGSFQESCQEGQSLVRYVLDGQGSVQVSSDEDAKQISMAPGSLLEVTGEATLSWEVTTDEMILLTPGFEQLGLFAGVAVALVVLLGSLIASS